MVMNRIKTRVQSYDLTRNRANEFLALNHPSFDLPVPIEKIIHNVLGIEIVPTYCYPGIDGFITGDLNKILVNKNIYKDNHYQFRYILAREIGLKWMYEDVFDCADYQTPEGWHEFIRSLEDGEYWQIISDINYFAGLLLVPPGLLRMEYEELSIPGNQKIERLMGTFQVEQKILIRRMEEEKLPKFNGLSAPIVTAKSTD